MGLRVKMELQGMTVALAKLKDVDKQVRKRVVKKAVTAGSQEVVRAMKQTSPRQTGLLKRKATKKIKVYQGKVLAVMGAKRFKDPATGRNPANYAHLVEDGAKPHVIPRGAIPVNGRWMKAFNIQHPGARAQQYMRRAASQAEAPAMRRFKSKLTSELLIETR